MGHGDEEQGDSTEDEQGEGGAGARKGPGVVVFNPDGLVAVNHTLDRLAHYLNRNDDAKACIPKQKKAQNLHMTVLFILNSESVAVNVTLDDSLHPRKLI